MMKMSIAVVSIAVKNIALEREFYLGCMEPKTVATAKGCLPVC